MLRIPSAGSKLRTHFVVHVVNHLTSDQMEKMNVVHLLKTLRHQRKKLSQHSVTDTKASPSPNRHKIHTSPRQQKSGLQLSLMMS